MNLINAARTLGLWLDPLRQALFAPNIPFTHRWRLLILQQLNLIVLPIKTLPWLLSPAYRITWIPSRGRHKLRALVFEPAASRDSTAPRPLHVDFHSGAFAGGIAEIDNDFCHELCRKTGAVVVSVDYRVAPQHVYPAAHEDCEDAVTWLLINAREEFNADPSCLTVSGFSAGGNLMMVAGSRAKAAVGMYAAIDLRLPPWEKPKPSNFPKKDPMAVLLPLYDAYAGPARRLNLRDTRMNPILKPIEDLPSRILLIVPTFDVLVHEQVSFIERVQADITNAGKEDRRTADAVLVDDAFHGWFELPYLPADLREKKLQAHNLAIDFIARAQREAR